MTVLACTDGSELSLRPLSAGLAVLAPADGLVVATVVEAEDPTPVTGTGFAGGLISPEESWERLLDRTNAAQGVLERTVAVLGSVSDRVVRNAPCPVVTSVR